MKLGKLSSQYKAVLRRLRAWVSQPSISFPCRNLHGALYYSGEAGEVEESMRELAAVEALKVEKAEKEVNISRPSCSLTLLTGA